MLGVMRARDWDHVDFMFFTEEAVHMGAFNAVDLLQPNTRTC